MYSSFFRYFGVIIFNFIRMTRAYFSHYSLSSKNYCKFFISLNVSLFTLRMKSTCIFCWHVFIIIKMCTFTVFYRRVHTQFQLDFFSTYPVPYSCMFIGYVGILRVNIIQEHANVSLSFLWTFFEFEQPYETTIYIHISNAVSRSCILLYLFRKCFYVLPQPGNTRNYLFSVYVCYNYYNGLRRSARKQL